MGLLDKLGILDQYKISPTEGPGGMMTQASPFTRQAARNIGGLLGMDMRSNPEILRAELSKLDPTDPDAEAAQLASLVKYGTPAQQVQATQRLTALRKEKNKAADERREKQERIALVKSLVDKKYGEREDIDDLKELASQGASLAEIEDAVEQDEQDYEILQPGSILVDAATGEVITRAEFKQESQKYDKVEFIDSETGEKIIEFVDRTDPTNTVRTIRSGAPSPELSQQSQIQLREANKEYRAASSRAAQANSLATNLEQLTQEIPSGLRAQIAESIKGIVGEEDVVTLLRTQAQALRIGIAVANLPPGPASDKDIKLVLSGTLDANANPKTLAEYARGVAKLAKMESRFHSDQAAWINKYKDVGGYLDHVSLRNYNDKIAYIDNEFSKNLPGGFSTMSDYLLALTNKQSLTPDEALLLSDFEEEIGESVVDMFNRRDAAARRLKEVKRDKF